MLLTVQSRLCPQQHHTRLQNFPVLFCHSRGHFLPTLCTKCFESSRFDQINLDQRIKSTPSLQETQTERQRKTDRGCCALKTTLSCAGFCPDDNDVLHLPHHWPRIRNQMSIQPVWLLGTTPQNTYCIYTETIWIIIIIIRLFPHVWTCRHTNRPHKRETCTVSCLNFNVHDKQ